MNKFRNPFSFGSWRLHILKPECSHNIRMYTHIQYLLRRRSYQKGFSAKATDN